MTINISSALGKFVKIIALVLFSNLFFVSSSAQTCPAVCAVTGAANDYWPGASNVTSGVTTAVTLGARRTGTGVAGIDIAIGDLVLIIQMQDATFNNANSTAYGANGTTGTGYTAARQTGLYEYAVATNAVTAAGGTLNLSKVTVNSYNITQVATAQTVPTYQIIRVPNCLTVNLSGSVTGAAWNGTTGGVVSVRGYNVSAAVGSVIDVNGLGFRGGATDAHNGPVSPVRYNGTNANDQYKAEGIAGTPDYIFDTSSGTETATLRVLPGGYRAIGAPGNAGGGGSGDSGGGGGGNGGSGGRGGVWSAGLAGGLGGAVFTQAGRTQVVLGGGGAGGSANTGATTASEAVIPYGTGTNSFNRGGAGGGIVILGAVARTGTFTINANGSNSTGTAYASTTVGTRVGGGGGAGGSIVLYGSGGTITANAAGGNGFLDTATSHIAHGGGGGGGVVLVNGALAGVTTVVSAGLAGCAQTGALSDTAAASCSTSEANSSTNGAAGAATVFASAAEPGLPSCAVNLSIAKSNAVATVSAGQTTTYTLTITNTGPSAADGALLKDPVAAGLSCTAVSCTSSTPLGNCPAPASITIANLQGAGITLTSLPAISTLTFDVVCGVTATGL